jgi:hypothetical protein
MRTTERAIGSADHPASGQGTPSRLLAGVLVVALALALLVATAGPASAGGWAVSTLDPVPRLDPGVALRIGFTIRQHGVTPVAIEGVAIVVKDAQGATTRFDAASADVVGRYEAEVMFPEAGTYEWEVIQGWFGPQPLGVITIAARPSLALTAPPASPPTAAATLPTTAAAYPPGATGWTSWRWVSLIALGMVLGAASLDLSRRRPSRRTTTVPAPS